MEEDRETGREGMQEREQSKQNDREQLGCREKALHIDGEKIGLESETEKSINRGAARKVYGGLEARRWWIWHRKEAFPSPWNRMC